MQINNITYFQQALIEWIKLDTIFKPRPLSEKQILIMERNIYSNEKSSFPLALREFLFLTGAFCPFFVSGCYLGKKKENTHNAGVLLKDQKPAFSRIEDRPIWSFATHYESSSSFTFIYLDENDENPFVYFYSDEEHEAPVAQQPVVMAVNLTPVVERAPAIRAVEVIDLCDSE
jgi:hypothetical protein